MVVRSHLAVVALALCSSMYWSSSRSSGGWYITSLMTTPAAESGAQERQAPKTAKIADRRRDGERRVEVGIVGQGPVLDGGRRPLHGSFTGAPRHSSRTAQRLTGVMDRPNRRKRALPSTIAKFDPPDFSPPP